MSTHARIGMEQEGGKVKSIYCHFDGYPSHVGRILNESFKDHDKVKALIELGDISYLEGEIEPTGPHSFASPQEGVTVAYHRDRGEDLQFNYDSSVPAFFASQSESYIYMFTQEGEWLVKRTGANDDPMTFENYPKNIGLQ
jgi:hypothetical protein